MVSWNGWNERESVFNLSWGESQLVEAPHDEDQQPQPVSAPPYISVCLYRFEPQDMWF